MRAATAGSFGRPVVVATIALAACAVSRPVAPTPAVAIQTFAVLRAENESFPKAAKAATESLARARVKGLDEPKLSKVSLEVVQLAIECVEPTVDCYVAVGNSISANLMLFAEIDASPKPNQLKVRITLFDVDARRSRRAAERVFSTEDDAVYGIADVVAEATRP